MIQPERVKNLNFNATQPGKYVLYWMQAAMRADYNHSLEYAIIKANELKLPLLVCFGITDDYPEANLRHYHFMLTGLQETQTILEKRRIKLLIQQKSPELLAIELASSAAMVITDDGPTRIQRQWRKAVANAADCLVVQVETNVIVPIMVASDKENYSAGTFRPRINAHLAQYLIGLEAGKVKNSSLKLAGESFDLSDINKALGQLKIDYSVKPTSFIAGNKAAQQQLQDFIDNKLADYDKNRNNPVLDATSNMSIYLHFGQISPLYIALEVGKSQYKAKASFLEELIVRRELSYNFVHYNDKYDKFEALPNWAINTLNFHKKDKRQYNYNLEELEQAQTDDPYWNAAQMEMVKTGKMAGYMRMYWGKKILEWSKNPKKAFANALYLNNKYQLDGRGPNAFAGVAWCFGKHDRPWGRREIFGQVRYMNESGLKRKFKPDDYVAKIAGETEKV